MEKYGKTWIVRFGDNEAVQGYSVSQIIQTSQISAHFAEKTDSSYVDIFSCREYDPKVEAKFTADFFRSKDYTYNVLLRGATKK